MCALIPNFKSQESTYLPESLEFQTWFFHFWHIGHCFLKLFPLSLEPSESNRVTDWGLLEPAHTSLIESTFKTSEILRATVKYSYY